MPHQAPQRPPEAAKKPGPPAARKRVGQAIRLWAGVTLGGFVVVAGFALWHLWRRGRLLREGGLKSRRVDWPTSDPTPSEPDL